MLHRTAEGRQEQTDADAGQSIPTPPQRHMHVQPPTSFQLPTSPILQNKNRKVSAHPPKHAPNMLFILLCFEKMTRKVCTVSRPQRLLERRRSGFLSGCSHLVLSARMLARAARRLCACGSCLEGLQLHAQVGDFCLQSLIVCPQRLHLGLEGCVACVQLRDPVGGGRVS